MDFTTSQRKCINDKYCDKQHFMRKMKDSASDWFVVNTSDFIDMWRLHKKYVEKCRDIVCPSDDPCDLHKKLRDMTDYVECVRHKNLNCKYEIIKTTGVVYSSNSYKEKAFWWINIIEWEVIAPPDDASIRRRSNFV